MEEFKPKENVPEFFNLKLKQRDFVKKNEKKKGSYQWLQELSSHFSTWTKHSPLR